MEGGTRTTAPARLLELDNYGTKVAAAALAVAQAYAEADAQAAYDREIAVALEAAATAAAEEIAADVAVQPEEGLAE
jgi:hypothetical protein